MTTPEPSTVLGLIAVGLSSIVGFRLFGTWYGSIWGHKSTKSLSGKRFN
ncbi:MAG: PEP-CTERM sorting domain-containing protein [Microcystis sp.]|nr:MULTISPECIES: PEP-CTERM sorting domain-containing protein [Microcystis]